MLLSHKAARVLGQRDFQFPKPEGRKQNTLLLAEKGQFHFTTNSIKHWYHVTSFLLAYLSERESCCIEHGFQEWNYKLKLSQVQSSITNSYHSIDCHLDGTERLACTDDPKTNTVGSLVLLIN